MIFDVAWTADQVDKAAVEGSAAVVIDALRATTTIAACFAAGAKEVWPVTGVEEARDLARRLGPDTLLAGERGSLPPEGFHLGNSPLEATPERVGGRRIVLTTTNGTRAIHACAGAQALVTAAYVNAGAVVQWLTQAPRARVYVACAGTQGSFSLDDALCAGLILSRLRAALGESEPIEESDAAVAAQALYAQFGGSVRQAIGACAHGRNLTKMGMTSDLDFAADVDRLSVVAERSPDQPNTIVKGALP